MLQLAHAGHSDNSDSNRNLLLSLQQVALVEAHVSLSPDTATSEIKFSKSHQTLAVKNGTNVLKHCRPECGGITFAKASRPFCDVLEDEGCTTGL
eukprot:2840726-Amphidinium_carterae.1